MRVVLALSLLVTAGLAGCAQVDGTAEVQESVDHLLPAVLAGDRIRVNVTVPVYMIGYDDDAAAELQSRLDPHVLDHALYRNVRGGPLAPDAPLPPTQPHHIMPAARYDVTAVPLGDLHAVIRDTKVDGQYLAVETEDAIAAHLETHGHALNNNTPALVFLHLGEQGHRYRIQYETGHVDNVRVFGERLPMLVMDVSAAPDPWVWLEHDYQNMLDKDQIEPLEHAARAATEFRLLQAPLYPPTIKPCHAVTLITAARGTALATHLPGYADPQDLVDTEYLTEAWEALLGEGRVHVDAVFLDLPQDDPALEVILRNGPSEALRFWMDENWDDYWVAHDGCEAYVSLFLIGDATDSGVSGIAMYDVRDDRRLSWSAMNDMTRFSEEQDGAFAPIFYDDDPSRDRLDWLNFLYSHETGHLFGQRHPHDISLRDGGDYNPTFSSIHSAMSYQQDGKMPLFSAIDANNQARNRVGFLFDGLRESEPEHPALDEALAHMGWADWTAARDVLEAALY